MAIAIQLGDIYDIETYDGLVAYIIAHLELDAETALQVPNFIRKAEYRLDRLLSFSQRESSSVLSVADGDTFVALPEDCRAVRSVKAGSCTLKQVSLDELNDHYGQMTGAPVVYAISDEKLLVGPAQATDLTVTYLARLPALSDATQTNWLLLNNADAYVYGALWQACAWLEDVDAATAFRAEMMEIIGEINQQGSRYRYGGPLIPKLRVAV